MDGMKIGEFIAQCRKEKGITQQQLADMLEITNKAVSKWETGNGLPDITILSKLAKILNVSVDEILNAERVNKTITVNQEINHNGKIDETNVATVTKQENNPAFIMTNYLVNKAITRFKLLAAASILLSVAGIVVPYFIWLDTQDLTGLLFGCWLEICSGGIFIYYYTIMKKEITCYNYSADPKINLKNVTNKYLRILCCTWLITPVILIVSIIL